MKLGSGHTGAARLRTASSPGDQKALEHDLARALRRGERAAGAAMWDHFSPLVNGLLARAFGVDEGNEDAMQEIFLRLFHKGRSLRDPNRLRSFVVAVTVNFIRSELRKRRLRRAFMLPAANPPALRDQTGDASATSAGPRLALAALYRALDTLSVRERMAFTLRFFEGLELSEAAALSGTSLATFKRHLSAAKSKLWALAKADPWLSGYVRTDLGFEDTEGGV